MKPLTAADCLWPRVKRVLEEARPSHEKEGTAFAVFAGSTKNGAFCGLATERDIASHPDWIFADLVEHRPLHAVAPDTPLRAVLQLMSQTGMEALPVVDGNDRYVGAVTQSSLLRGLLAQEHKLLGETQQLYRFAEDERRQLAAWSGRLTKLHEASRTLLNVLAHTALEDELLQVGIDALASLLEAHYGAIGLLDKEGGLAQFVHTGISAEQAQKIGHLPEGRGLLGMVIQDNVAIRLADMSKHPRSAGFPPHHPPMKTLLAVPVSHGGRVYGRIYLSDKVSGELFTEEDELLAMSFAHSLSLVLDNAREIEEITSARKRLDYLAHFDTLTGLPNRELATDRIRQALVQAHRHGGIVAVLFVDLDNFKHVNDSFGHTIGDQLLQNVAQRLLACVREGDTVARLSGDEFIVMLPDITDVQDAATVAQKILDMLAPPCELETHEVFISASIGISVFPHDATDMEELVRNADKAMYHAKSGGRNAYQFFTASMNAATQRYTELEHALRRALERDEFCLHYQPQVDMESGRIMGVEALLRWENPKLGQVSPAEFIPLAEDSGLIVPIGDWVLKTACAQGKIWADMGFDSLRVAVNLSARQFRHQGFTATLARILADSGLPVNMLELEITESTMMQDMAAVIAILHEIKAMGIRVSIDDFGTGYSSLNYLKRFPIGMLKIDQSFVRDVTTDPDDAAIVKAIITMAHSLRLSVIAEGVETEGQLAFLGNHRCNEIQGYLFSRPVTAEVLTGLLQEGRRLDTTVVRDQSQPRTLLLVDDEVNIATSLKRLLRGDGYRILTAASGREGLELLATNPVGVIISDQRMPEMTGVEFLRLVKELYPDTVRIVLSGYTDLKSITDAINEGAIYKFLTKPWEDDQLRDNVREAFQHHELKQENARLAHEIEHTNRDLERRVAEKTQEIRHNINVLQVSQEVLEHLPTAVIGIDDDGLIVMANREADALFGNGGGPLLGGEAQARLPDALAACIATTDGGVSTIALADGRRLHVRCHRMGEMCKSKGTVLVLSPVDGG